MRRLIGLSIGMLATVGTLAAQDPLVYRIPISGTIENGLAPYVARSLSEAEAAGARLVVLDIDTPGGRIDAGKRSGPGSMGRAAQTGAALCKTHL